MEDTIFELLNRIRPSQTLMIDVMQLDFEFMKTCIEFMELERVKFTCVVRNLSEDTLKEFNLAEIVNGKMIVDTIPKQLLGADLNNVLTQNGKQIVHMNAITYEELVASLRVNLPNKAISMNPNALFIDDYIREFTKLEESTFVDRLTNKLVISNSEEDKEQYQDGFYACILKMVSFYQRTCINLT